MITLDMSSIESTNDEIYSYERGSNGIVFLDGKELKGCVYCNVTKGVAIRTKRELSGLLIVAEGSIVHELVFGEITFQPRLRVIDAETQRRNHAIKVASNRPKDYDWFDSCRPDDRN